MTTDDNRPQQDEQLLRQALHNEAAKVLPSPDVLARIRARTARAPLWRSPLALGMAAARYVTRPSGSSTPMISMCSASQPSWRACQEAMRSAWHFLPSSALPP